MGILVDLILIAVVSLSTFLAYRKGLVKLAMGLFAYIIAIVLTIILYQPISNLIINSTTIDEAIEKGIYEKANDIMQENNEDESLTNQILETAKNDMLPETARTLSVNIIKGIVMLVLIVAIRIALKFVTFLSDIIAKLPIISQFNQLGGIVYGVLRGIFLIYLVFLIIGVFEQIDPNNAISNGVNQSYISKEIYNHNILSSLFNH